MTRPLAVVPYALLLALLVATLPTATATPVPDGWLPDCVPGDLECGWTPPTVNDVYGWAKTTLQRLVPDCNPGDLECGWPY